MLQDIVFYPAKYYHSGRYLPFPGIDMKGLENLGVYLPIAITIISLYALAARRLRNRRRPPENLLRPFDRSRTGMAFWPHLPFSSS